MIARQYTDAELAQDFLRTVMDDQLGRGYLNRLPDASLWEVPKALEVGQYGWLRFERLPIRPDEENGNSLLESWQSVLSACHTINLQIAFVLQRLNGKTLVFLGAKSGDGNTRLARQQLQQCMAIHMPGAELSFKDDAKTMRLVMENYSNSGVVCGIPSLRGERSGFSLQTLDKRARHSHRRR